MNRTPAEIARPPAVGEGGFFGRRPWPVLAFFIALGMLNLTKGLFFGTLLVGAAVAAYMLACRDLARVRRYVWFWGWLAYLAVSLPWPSSCIAATCPRMSMRSGPR